MAGARDATTLIDLTALVSSSGGSTVFPSEDALLGCLQARFRNDLPYTRLRGTTLVAINPYKALANVNDASAKDYEDKCYKDVDGDDGTRLVQPHPYELAARMYFLMRRRNESQGVVFRGVTGSGKSHTARLLTNQLLRLATHSKREVRLAEQIRAFNPILESFGNAKTLMNGSASRHSSYTELHFNDKGRIVAAKILAFGLDKSRLSRLSQEERSYHVFYQLLAGATPDERDAFLLEDPSDYALLASSGCYRLPGGPFSDDSINMDELRASLKILGFKPKHTSAIFSLLVAILLLGNLQFADYGTKEITYESARIINAPVLERVSHMLGVEPEALEQALTNKTNYVRKELMTVVLPTEGAIHQRDRLVQDLYAILFAYVIETANHRVAPPLQGSPPPFTQIILYEQPGFQSRAPTGSVSFNGPAPLVAAYGQNKFDEFCINFQNEILHSYITRNIFEDGVGYNALLAGDNIPLPAVNTMDNAACVELLRGVSDPAQKRPAGVLGVIGKSALVYRQGRATDRKDDDLLQELGSTFGAHASYVRNPSQSAADRTVFGINHYAGNCTYDIGGFVERDADMLDSAFVSLLRGSSETFIAKLVSGPSLATEAHHNDPYTVVQAQVSSRPLRQPTPIFSADGSLPPDSNLGFSPQTISPVTTQLDSTLTELMAALDQTHLWNVACVRPNDSGSANSFDKRRVKSQIRSLLLPDAVARRTTEYVTDYEFDAFCERYAYSDTEGQEITERIHAVAREHGLVEGPDYTVGLRSVWLSFPAFKILEDPLRAAEKERRKIARGLAGGSGGGDDESVMEGDDVSMMGGDWKGTGGIGDFGESVDNILRGGGGTGASASRGFGDAGSLPGYGTGGLRAPNMGSTRGPFADPEPSVGWGSDWEKGGPIDTPRSEGTHASSPLNPNGGGGGGSLKSGKGGTKEMIQTVEEVPTTSARRWWLRWVWLMTWWAPSWCLSRVGRMKRPDVRLAWREKVTICIMIFSFCGLILFYIIVFGKLLCPGQGGVFSENEMGGHNTETNFWVSVAGEVYDITKFWRGDHSNVPGVHVTNADMIQLAGKELTGYFPVPLAAGCAGLVTDANLALTAANTTIDLPQAVHKSGLQTSYTGALTKETWYQDTFLPAMKAYRKGTLVYTRHAVSKQANDAGRIWAIWDKEIFDLSDYFYTIALMNNQAGYAFFDQSVTNIFKQQPGQDISKEMNAAMAKFDKDTKDMNYACLKNNFYYGRVDFRDEPRCKVQNYILLAFSGLIGATLLAKFLAALQLGSKRHPEMLDKFVICQVPCYTEGEESLRRTIDSLAALRYDDKRKLMFLICDGNIIGSGNDRTTPRIALDILGVDPSLDPEPLLFKSVGEGSKQLNYGKVYSGLYEFEGHVVPYMVVVKVGKPSERSRPGNRGKRDSQILLMQYLNRVHFDAPMNPLELEIYHQMRNVIGIDPAFYEYILMVDADTSVTPDSVNRLVACASDDAQIIAICGETKLDNEEGSWWTMVQVYEYYISHHLSKAFESLFGSVTCLPGCFSLYRIRTSDKGRPLIISNRVIDDYSVNEVDTLHKKNLLSLGEDRYLTTIMMTHFPTFKMKFTPDAIAHTVAPDRFGVLLSQRRRWINSTIHNLVELVFLPDLCGFCIFSMRFFVFLDLIGTIILPATVVYLVYLIIIVATGQAAVPILALVMLGATYGLQAIIFLLKREFMLVGWLIMYLLAYPIYGFFLPVYSFWCMDDFSWGNTRVVVGEGSNKKVIVEDDEKYDDSMIPLKRFSEYEAEAWETRSTHSAESRATGKPPSRLTGRGPSPLGFQQNNSQIGLNAQAASMHAMSQYGGPQLPMPFMGGGFGGSQAGSDYGGNPFMPSQQQLAQHTGMSMNVGMPGYTGSMYGMGGPMAPRNSVMTNLNMYGGGAPGGSLYGGLGGPGGIPGGSIGAFGNQRPQSTFSMGGGAPAAPLPEPSTNPNPSDEEILVVLRNYLGTQDLMTVTKKTTRQAMAARFPNADLTAKKDFINSSIDSILSA